VVCCLSVCEHISRSTHPIFTKVFGHVSYGCGWILCWQRRDRLCISRCVNDVIFTHQGPASDQWRRQDFVTGGSEVWVYRGSRVRSPPEADTLLQCTHILHIFWTSTHRGEACPLPLWLRHCIGLRAQCDICDYHVSCCGVSMSAFVAANQSERPTEPVDFGGARRRNDDGCDGRTDGQTDRQTRSDVPRLQVCAVQARSADAACVVVQLITASSSPSPAAAATEGLEET